MISEAHVEAAIETIVVPRHIALVRITHWIIVLSVIGLLVSGIGILVGHPRLYWGETGSLATPSLIDLPIPFIIGPSVWYRPYHFFFAWILVLTGLTYMAGGFITRHFRKDLLPAKADLRWKSIVNVRQAGQNQNPRKEEMIRTVPYRGADDKRNRKIDEGRSPKSTRFTPVQARVRNENPCAADKQANHAQPDHPVRDTNDREM